MNEKLLQYIWQYQLFNHGELRTSDGERLTIIESGKINHFAGPDFLEAKVKIGELEWVGSIEIHIKSSEWFAHKHQQNPDYKTVILHVVLEHDMEEFHIPTLELNDRISNHLLERYQTLMDNQDSLPCAPFIHQVNPFDIQLYKQRLLAERMEEKSKRINEQLNLSHSHWNQVFYEQMAYNFGLTTNAESMQELAKRVPLLLIQKYKNNLRQIEALLFGTAGFLHEENKGIYQTQLRTEYQFLKQKHQLVDMATTNWNFGRVRPPSFPTLRIAQLASLLFHSQGLFSKLMKRLTIEQIQRYLSIKPSEYWLTHYRFGEESPEKEKMIAKSKIENLIINTIVPFQFIYGKRKQDEQLIEHSLQLLEQLSPEKNKITRIFENLNFTNSSAFDSQALLYLYKTKCVNQRCMNCRIGHQILKKNA